MSQTEGHNQQSGNLEQQSEDTQSSETPSRQRPENVQRTPTIKPTLVALGITILGLVVAIALILSNAQSLGGQNTAEVAVQVVGVLGILIILRFAIRIFVLTRTTYEVDEERIQRKYSLFLRTKVREVPIEMIRSSQLQQNRIQNLMGYGDIKVNEDLGAINIENVSDPHQIQSLISSFRQQKSNSD